MSLLEHASNLALYRNGCIGFDVPDRPALQRLPLLDPLRGTREQVGQMIDECTSVTELFAALGR